MTKHFAVGTPQTVNSAQADAALERIAAKVAEMIAPAMAESVANQLKANGSNGRKMPTGDDFDTLPDGDDQPRPQGDDFSNLPD